MMTTLHVMLVLLATFSWIFMLSGVSKERNNQTIVVQEGKGTEDDRLKTGIGY